MHYIFPDTNIFLHGKDFEEIGWSTWLKANEVTLVLTAIVISELDKHKYNPNKKVSKRAKSILPKLEAIIDDPSKSKISVITELYKPLHETFEKHSLDIKEQDDSLLAAIIEFRGKIGEHDSIILVTNDTGPRLKAISHLITAKKLPPEFLIGPELDDNERKIIALEKELIEYKSKVPILALNFLDGNKYIVVDSRPEIKSKSEYVEEKMRGIENEFQPLVFQKLGDANDLTSIGLSMFGLNETQVNSYNDDLTKFYKKYQKYFELEYDSFLYSYHIFEISIRVENSGFVPANDIDIQLHFPDGFDIICEDDFPADAKKPKPPFKPKHSWDVAPFKIPIPNLTNLYSHRNSSVDLSYINTNVSSPDIKKTNSYDVKFHVKSIKHNQNVELETLYLKFPNIKLAEGFPIDYRIYAANVPKTIIGSLNVRFPIER